MKNILFKDVPSEDSSFIKNAKKWKVTSLAFCVVFAILGMLGFIFGKNSGENRYLLLIASIAGFVLFSGIFISACCQAKQYLIVYDNAIKYKKGFYGKKQLLITPNDYKIKLKKFTHRGSYTACILFLNQQNKRLLSYKLSQCLTNEQRQTLYNIGCEIVDRQRILEID